MPLRRSKAPWSVEQTSRPARQELLEDAGSCSSTPDRSSAPKPHPGPPTPDATSATGASRRHEHVHDHDRARGACSRRSPQHRSEIRNEVPPHGETSGHRHAATPRLVIREVCTSRQQMTHACSGRAAAVDPAHGAAEVLRRTLRRDQTRPARGEKTLPFWRLPGTSTRSAVRVFECWQGPRPRFGNRKTQNTRFGTVDSMSLMARIERRWDARQTGLEPLNFEVTTVIGTAARIGDI